MLKKTKGESFTLYIYYHKWHETKYFEMVNVMSYLNIVFFHEGIVKKNGRHNKSGEQIFYTKYTGK